MIPQLCLHTCTFARHLTNDPRPTRPHATRPGRVNTLTSQQQQQHNIPLHAPLNLLTPPPDASAHATNCTLNPHPQPLQPPQSRPSTDRLQRAQKPASCFSSHRRPRSLGTAYANASCVRKQATSVILGTRSGCVPIARTGEDRTSGSANLLGTLDDAF